MVTLINTSGKIKVYNLDHPFFRTKKWGARRMNVQVIEEHKDGRRMPKTLKRSFPGVITLLAGESREGLPDQVQAVPAIRKDIRDKRIKVVKEGKAAHAKAKAAPAAPTSDKKTTRRGKE